ncbi:MAG: hypothetical protein ABSH09_22380 [Bryobacteraceae bacterium]
MADKLVTPSKAKGLHNLCRKLGSMLLRGKPQYVRALMRIREMASLVSSSLINFWILLRGWNEY